MPSHGQKRFDARCTKLQFELDEGILVPGCGILCTSCVERLQRHARSRAKAFAAAPQGAAAMLLGARQVC